jgi:hypothetical protein
MFHVKHRIVSPAVRPAGKHPGGEIGSDVSPCLKARRAPESDWSLHRRLRAMFHVKHCFRVCCVWTVQ